jgi:hypothetical protein
LLAKNKPLTIIITGDIGQKVSKNQANLSKWINSQVIDNPSDDNKNHRTSMPDMIGKDPLIYFIKKDETGEKLSDYPRDTRKKQNLSAFARPQLDEYSSMSGYNDRSLVQDTNVYNKPLYPKRNGQMDEKLGTFPPKNRKLYDYPVSFSSITSSNPHNSSRISDLISNMIPFITTIRKKMVLVETVDNNILKYTKKEAEKAELAFKLLRRLGRPSIKDFLQLIKSNKILDCPIGVSDVERAIKIYGNEAGIMMGKTTRKKSDPLVDELLIRKETDYINLYVDLIYTYGLIFMVSISKGYNLIIVAHQ